MAHIDMPAGGNDSNAYNSKNINISGQVSNNYGNINEEDDILICDSYEIFEDKEFNGFVMESLNNTPYDIAKVL